MPYRDSDSQKELPSYFEEIVSKLNSTKNYHKEVVIMDDKTVQLISKGLSLVARAIVIAIKAKNKQK